MARPGRGRRDLTAEQLADIHRGKTGALIRACCELGGMAAGANLTQMAALTGFGQEVGLAFQVADDLLDATGSSASWARRPGRDALLAKSTYVSLLGVARRAAEAERLVALAIARLQHSQLQAETAVRPRQLHYYTNELAAGGQAGGGRRAVKTVPAYRSRLTAYGLRLTAHGSQLTLTAYAHGSRLTR
jgi:geranylgeranyl pyrophosphate synthase